MEDGQMQLEAVLKGGRQWNLAFRADIWAILGRNDKCHMSFRGENAILKRMRLVWKP